ncbi:hypothetical protein OAO42_00180 [Candidatus Izimaplasma bacterium]|nr:hypothetical protein [Candidatus Izimaplasma bacterium]
MKYPSFKGPIIYAVSGIVLTILFIVLFVVNIVSSVDEGTHVLSGSPVTLDKGTRINVFIENDIVTFDTTYLVNEENDGSVTIQFIRDFDVVVAYNISIMNSVTDNTVVIDEPFTSNGAVDDETTLIGSINIRSKVEYTYTIEVVEGISDSIPELSYHYNEVDEVLNIVIFAMLAYLTGIFTVLGSVIYLVIISSKRSRYRFNQKQEKIQEEENEYYKQFQTKNQNS